jgi:hypothetical protein
MNCNSLEYPPSNSSKKVETHFKIMISENHSTAKSNLWTMELGITPCDGGFFKASNTEMNLRASFQLNQKSGTYGDFMLKR